MVQALTYTGSSVQKTPGLDVYLDIWLAAAHSQMHVHQAPSVPVAHIVGVHVTALLYNCAPPLFSPANTACGSPAHAIGCSNFPICFVYTSVTFGQYAYQHPVDQIAST